MQQAIEHVHVSESVGLYMVDVVQATRDSARTDVGASPRGSLALYKLARCRAALRGRDYVLPDDVKAVAAPALGHRLTLKPELWVRRVRPEAIVADILETVAAPAGRGPRAHARMTRSASSRLGAYAAFVAAAFLVALFMGRPDVAALGAPFAAFLVVALLFQRTPKLTVALTLAEERTVEGEPVAATLEVSSDAGLDQVELALVLPYGVELGEGASASSCTSHRARRARFRSSSCRGAGAPSGSAARPSG